MTSRSHSHDNTHLLEFDLWQGSTPLLSKLSCAAGVMAMEEAPVVHVPFFFASEFDSRECSD